MHRSVFYSIWVVGVIVVRCWTEVLIGRWTEWSWSWPDYDWDLRTACQLAVSCRERESCDCIGIGARRISSEWHCDTAPRWFLRSLHLRLQLILFCSRAPAVDLLVDRPQLLISNLRLFAIPTSVHCWFSDSTLFDFITRRQTHNNTIWRTVLIIANARRWQQVRLQQGPWATELIVYIAYAQPMSVVRPLTGVSMLSVYPIATPTDVTVSICFPTDRLALVIVLYLFHIQNL